MKIEDVLSAAKPQLRQINVADKVMNKVAKKTRWFGPAQAWALGAVLVVATMPLAASVTNALTHGYWDDYMSVMQKTEKTIVLPNGNRVIAIDASWCGTYGVSADLDSAKTDKSTTREYYEIKKGSNVTDKDVLDWRKTNCEASLVGKELEGIAKNLKTTDDKVIISTGFLTVASAKATSLDIYSPALHADGWTDPGGKMHEAVDMPEKHYVFNHSVAETKVRDIPGSSLALTNLKAGDSVTAFIAVNKSASPYCNTEQNVLGDSPCELSLFPTTNPGDLLVVVRAQPYDSAIGSPVQLGANVFTVVPCSTSMNGLCASGEMNEKGQYTHPTPLVSWPIWQFALLGGALILAIGFLATRKRQTK